MFSLIKQIIEEYTPCFIFLEGAAKWASLISKFYYPITKPNIEKKDLTFFFLLVMSLTY